MPLLFKKENGKDFTETEKLQIRELKQWNKCDNYERARYWTDHYMKLLKANGITLL